MLISFTANNMEENEKWVERDLKPGDTDIKAKRAKMEGRICVH